MRRANRLQNTSLMVHVLLLIFLATRTMCHLSWPKEAFQRFRAAPSASVVGELCLTLMVYVHDIRIAAGHVSGSLKNSTFELSLKATESD